MEEFKVGDVVKIVGNSYDGVFDLGDIVVVSRVLEYAVTVTYDGFEQDYAPEDLVLFAKPRKPVELKSLSISNPDNVNHPSHYNESGIECIEAIRATLGSEFPAYCKGNVMKYLWRYQYKNGIEDIKKAQVYLNWMVEYLEEKETNV